MRMCVRPFCRQIPVRCGHPELPPMPGTSSLCTSHLPGDLHELRAGGGAAAGAHRHVGPRGAPVPRHRPGARRGRARRCGRAARVVCCYPDSQRLLAPRPARLTVCWCSATRPRNPITRTMFSAENGMRRLKGETFRHSCIHPRRCETLRLGRGCATPTGGAGSAGAWSAWSVDHRYFVPTPMFSGAVKTTGPQPPERSRTMPSST